MPNDDKALVDICRGVDVWRRRKRVNPKPTCHAISALRILPLDYVLMLTTLPPWRNARYRTTVLCMHPAEAYLGVDTTWYLLYRTIPLHNQAIIILFVIFDDKIIDTQFGENVTRVLVDAK